MKDLYQPHLDALRGIMAMWVFVGHTAQLCGFSSILIPPNSIAVDVFMFLSGLLMTRNFLARQDVEPLDSTRTIIKFLIRRFFRIAPLYYTLLIISLVFWAYYVRFWQEAGMAFPMPWADLIGNDPSQHEPTLANVLAHISFFFGFFPQYAANNALPDWSLSLEMQFYVAIPFILLLARRTGFTLVATTFMIIQLICRYYIGSNIGQADHHLVWPQPTLLPLKINCFMVGVLMATYFNKKSLDVIVLMFVTMFFKQDTIFSGSALFCFLAMNDSGESSLERIAAFVKKIISRPAWIFFGDISYGVYLVHNLIIIPLIALLLKIDGYRTMPPVVRFAILLGMAAMIVIPSAYALHRRIELPGIEFGRRLASRMRGRREIARSAL